MITPRHAIAIHDDGGPIDAHHADTGCGPAGADPRRPMMPPALDAGDQLVDEWLAHVWALHVVAPDVCRGVDRATVTAVRRRAVDVVRDLGAGLLSRAEVLRLAHPLGPPAPTDGW
jgi:hypothetical protein